MWEERGPAGQDLEASRSLATASFTTSRNTTAASTHQKEALSPEQTVEILLQVASVPETGTLPLSFPKSPFPNSEQTVLGWSFLTIQALLAWECLVGRGGPASGLCQAMRQGSFLKCLHLAQRNNTNCKEVSTQ